MSYRGDREMHKATCGDCGKDCEVPFEPRQDKPVYCNECFPNHKRAKKHTRIMDKINPIRTYYVATIVLIIATIVFFILKF